MNRPVEPPISSAKSQTTTETNSKNRRDQEQNRSESGTGTALMRSVPESKNNDSLSEVKEAETRSPEAKGIEEPIKLNHQPQKVGYYG